RLSKLPFHVVFLCKSEAAMGLQTCISGLPRCFGSEHLCHVCLGTTVEFGFVSPQSLPNHQLGGAHRCICLCYRKLDALVLTDWSPEYSTLSCIGRSFIDKPLGVTDALRSDQNAFGIHAG